MAARRSRLFLLLGASACVALSSCAGAFSSNELQRAPAWFKARQKELAGQDYPKLADVPPLAKPAGNDLHWDAVQAELLAEDAKVKASPRSAEAATAANPDEFDRAAREAIEAARPK